MLSMRVHRASTAELLTDHVESFDLLKRTRERTTALLRQYLTLARRIDFADFA